MNNVEALRFRVVINDEGQYSIWPSEKPVPGGWRDVAIEGTKEECLAHVASVWTDLTPLSLRNGPATRSP